MHVVFWVFLHLTTESLHLKKNKNKKNNPWPLPFSSHIALGPQDLWNALVLLMLSKSFVCLSFTHGLLLRQPEWGSYFFLLVCKKRRHVMFIIVEFFSAKLKTYLAKVSLRGLNSDISQHINNGL